MLVVPFWYIVHAVLLLSVAFLVGYTTKFVLRTRYEHALETAKARWEAAKETAMPETLMESFTMGWFNILVQALWTPVLEKHISALSLEALQRLMNEILEKHSDKKPWMYLESIHVEQFTLGLVPPRFQFCFAKYDPQNAYLQFGMNSRFSTVGAQVIMSFRVKPLGALVKPFTTRLEVTHARISGRLNLGFQMTKEAPGIKGMDYSFATDPEFSLKASPVGVSLASELPGLVNALRNQLLRVMKRRMVEPNRRRLDIQRIYRNRHAARAGGPAGLLQVTILGAKNICEPTNTKAPATPPACAALCDPYCEVRYGKQVLRTPVVHNSCQPVWNWNFDFPLKCDPTNGEGDHRVHLAVYDARTLGDPGHLGSCQVDLEELNLTINGAPVPLVKPLRKGRENSTLQIQVSWLKSTKLKAEQTRTSGVGQQPPPARAGSPTISNRSGGADEKQQMACHPSRRCSSATSSNSSEEGLHERLTQQGIARSKSHPGILGLAESPRHLIPTASSPAQQAGTVEGSTTAAAVEQINGQRVLTAGRILSGGEGARTLSSPTIPQERLQAAAGSPAAKKGLQGYMSAGGMKSLFKQLKRRSSPVSDEAIIKTPTSTTPTTSVLDLTFRPSDISIEAQPAQEGINNHIQRSPSVFSASTLAALKSAGVEDDTPRALASMEQEEMASATTSGTSPMLLESLDTMLPGANMTTVEGPTSHVHSLEHQQEHSRAPRHSDSGGLSPFPGPSSYTSSPLASPSMGAWTSLVQISKLQRQLDKEQMAVEKLQTQLTAMTTAFNELIQLRKEENRRALMEGALWYHHKSKDDVRVVRMTYRPDAGCLKISHVQPRENGERGDTTWISVGNLMGVELGFRKFPGGHGAFWRMKARKVDVGAGPSGTKEAGSEPDDGKCITLLGLDMYHLQIPPGGNGRSCDEWVSGLKDIIQENKIVEEGTAQGAN